MNHDVFISYSNQDSEAAQAICHVLEQNEIRCWIAPRDVSPGSDFGDEIDEAIKSSKAVVVLFSVTASTSQFVKSELNIAFSEQKTIIPFRLDSTPLKGQNRLILNRTHWIDAYPDYKTKFNDLVDAVAMVIGNNKGLEYSSQTINIPDETSLCTHLRKKKWKYVIVPCLTLAIIAIILFIFHINTITTTSTYDKNGLHVELNELSNEQQEILISLLDSMVLVEGGTFEMGTSDRDSLYITGNDKYSIPRHSVILSDFYISKYELTQKQWSLIFDIDKVSRNKGKEKPVDYLSWDEAIKFADSLAAITHLNFSLPTEAQWEYAARGGKLTKNYIFSGSDDFASVGWVYDTNSIIHNVGEKEPNELGLYDMTGNVSELCLDNFTLYNSYTNKDPISSTGSSERVIRGGSIFTSPFDCKNTSRDQCEQSFYSRAVGMRLVININK